MAWPELLKAKKNIRNIEQEIDRTLKSHNAFTKREIARHHSTLLDDFEVSIEAINKELEEFDAHIRNHRKYITSKSRFMKRHYTRQKSF